MEPFATKVFTILRGVVYSVGFVWLWAWLAISLRQLDEQFPVSFFNWLRPVGIVVGASGMLLAGICIATFVTRGRGTPAPFDPPREFVATGPYRYVRNPMYVGGTAAILGAGLALSSPSIVMLAGAFLAIMHLFVVIHEEPALACKFGESYKQYRTAVHRWLIRIPSCIQIDTTGAALNRTTEEARRE